MASESTEKKVSSKNMKCNSIVKTSQLTENIVYPVLLLFSQSASKISSD